MPPPGESRDDRPDQRRSWHDLPLRAQGLVVIAVPVLGLASAAVLVAVEVGTGNPSVISIVTLAVLGVAIVAAATATLAFTQDLARRVNHLQSNAERLAHDAELAPHGPRIRRARPGREHPGPGGRGAGQPATPARGGPGLAGAPGVGGADGHAGGVAHHPPRRVVAPAARLHQLQQRPGHGPLAGRPAERPRRLHPPRAPATTSSPCSPPAAGPSGTPAARCRSSSGSVTSTARGGRWRAWSGVTRRSGPASSATPSTSPPAGWRSWPATRASRASAPSSTTPPP